MREHVPCPTCRREIQFGVDLVFGRTIQSCDCGSKPVPTHAPDIAPERAHWRHATIDAVCQWVKCGGTFQARKSQPGRFCSPECRRAHDLAAAREYRRQNPKARFKIWGVA